MAITISKTVNSLPAGHVLYWYEIASVIGRGAFGITYLAHDRNLGSNVAIKEYFPSEYASGGAEHAVVPASSEAGPVFDWGRDRFLAEAQTLVHFHHRSIVRVLSAFESHNTACMVMSYEPGPTLDRVVPVGAVMKEENILTMVRSLLDGIEQVHQADFIHRDIKPANIILREDGSPVLLDFGSARQAFNRERPTMTSIVTSGYAPFEQYNQKGKRLEQGPWTDVYALGALLYRLMSGRAPPDALSRATSMLEGEHDPLRVLAEVVGVDDYSDELRHATHHALAFSAQERPQSVHAWRARYPLLQQSATAASRGAPLPGGASRGPGKLPTSNAADLALAPATVLVEPGSAVDQDCETERPPTSRRHGASHDLSRIRVLVVDDQVFIVGIIKRMLNRLGVRRALSCGTGQTALEMVDRVGGRLDVIICDLNMSGMDGIEFLRHLADRPTPPSVILMSGGAKRLLETVGELAGARGLRVLAGLAKPVTMQALKGALERLGAVPARPVTNGVVQLSEDELRAGLEGDRVRVVYQPKVTVTDGELVGVESLVRWQDPDRGTLGAHAVVTVAEEYGLIDQLTDTVFERALKQTGRWRRDGLKVDVAINISVSSLARLELPERLTSLAQRAGVDPGNVTLEVSESRLRRDLLNSLEVLNRLRLKGLQLSLDDFGTGGSSLRQLSKAPFTELKIDRAFVAGATSDSAARAIIEAAIELARKLHMRLVAEGVETWEDWHLLAELGCHLMQGYLIAEPMAADELPNWYKQWRQHGLGQ